MAGGFLAFTVSARLVHAYTVFLLAFVQDFGGSRADASLAYSVGQVVGGVSSPPVDWVVDRLGPRRMVLPGGCLLTAGLLGSSQAARLWRAVLLHGVVMTLGGESHRARGLRALDPGPCGGRGGVLGAAAAGRAVSRQATARVDRAGVALQAVPVKRPSRQR